MRNWPATNATRRMTCWQSCLSRPKKDCGTSPPICRERTPPCWRRWKRAKWSTPTAVPAMPTPIPMWMSWRQSPIVWIVTAAWRINAKRPSAQGWQQMSKHIIHGLCAAAALLGALTAAGCDDAADTLKTPVFNSGLPAGETKASAFKEVFPRQYATYQRNDESQVMTEYKGSVPFHKNDDKNPLPKGFKYAQPYLKNLWMGYPFMYEYNEARGHTHAVEDFVHIDRINRYKADGKGDMPATCWNCKTPTMEQWVAKYGDKFWSMDVNEFRDKINVKDESISCATCHDAKSMELKLYSEPLKDWLARSGQKWENISRNDKRSLMCGQCHVEYYFTHPDNGVKGRPVFPWDKGFDPEQIYEYYNTHGPQNGPFTDFVHAVSKVNIIKVQHPEYETWINGPHGAAGVSCADCHMPYVKQDGKKASSH